jgi:hypothetical protein
MRMAQVRSGHRYFLPGKKIQGVLKTLSACLQGGLDSALRLFWENMKEKMASTRT